MNSKIFGRTFSHGEKNIGIPLVNKVTSITCLVAVLMSLPACVKGSSSSTITPPGPPVLYSGNQITVSVSNLSASATTGQTAAIRSSINYYRHWNYSYQDYTAHTHQVTRAVELNTALSLSTSANDFKNTILNLGTGYKSGVMYQEGLQKSDNLIAVFDSMPEWLSSCTSKTGSATACRAATTCGYNSSMKYFNLFPPVDWAAWKTIVTTTVDTLLDLTEYNGMQRNVYLEAWNEPNVRECSWNDTHASFMDYFHRTSVAFTQARNSLCASKGFSDQRCQRLKFGGPAVGVWNGKIDNARSTTLIEDLITDSLIQASTNSDHRLDFVSFHGFWGSVPGPRNQLTSARDLITNTYANAAGSTPAFLMPEIIISEWNGDDSTRASNYHPVVMAEAYFGLLENNISNAAIASLDAYTNTATLSTNDFGLLLPDAVMNNYQRPAFFVYSAFRNLAATSSQPQFYAKDSLRAVVTKTNTQNCYNLVLWDFAPDPLTSSVYKILSQLNSTTTELAQSYLTATYSGSAPASCNAYINASATPNATKALCSDIYNGNCTSIPIPTPSGGHACNTAWGNAFTEAGVAFRNLSDKLASPATVNISDFAGSNGLSQVTGTYIGEDHVQTAPKSLTLSLGSDAQSLQFLMARNTVVTLSNLCIGNQ